jgi:type III pantothenate kinase
MAKLLCSIAIRPSSASVSGRARVVATGGLAEIIAAETDVIEVVEPDLALMRLRMIYEMNQP